MLGTFTMLCHQFSECFLSCKMETLYPLNNYSPFFPSGFPGYHHSIFPLYGCSRAQSSRSSNYSLELGLSAQLDSGVWPFQICQEPSSIKRRGTKTSLHQTAKFRESVLWLMDSPFSSHFLPPFFLLLLSKRLLRDLADIDSWSPSCELSLCFLSGNCFLSSLSKLWHKIYIFSPMEEI